MRTFLVAMFVPQVSAATMTAVTSSGSCSAPSWSCIKEKTVTVPKAGRGLAVLEVLGSSVNPVDCDFVEAGYKSGTLGLDGSGKVVSVGSGCDLKVGDEVFGAFTGAYAQYATATCSGLAKKGRSFSHAEAGTLPIVAGTATQCLQSLDLPNLAKANHNLTVVVTSGQGGTGHMGIQLAKAMGANRVITACSGSGIALCRELGADVVVDYHTQELFSVLPDDSVDLIFDNYGTPGTADKAMHAIRSGGTFLVLEGGEGGKISTHPKQGVKQIPFGFQSSGRQELTYVAGLIDAGKVRPHIFASYGLHEVKEAWATLRGHGVLGKISIDPSNTTSFSLTV